MSLEFVYMSSVDLLTQWRGSAKTNYLAPVPERMSTFRSGKAFPIQLVCKKPIPYCTPTQVMLGFVPVDLLHFVYHLGYKFPSQSSQSRRGLAHNEQ